MIVVFMDGVNNSGIPYDLLFNNIVIATDFYNCSSIFGIVSSCGFVITELDTEKYNNWVEAYALGLESITGSCYLQKVINFKDILHDKTYNIKDTLRNFERGYEYTIRALESFYSEVLDKFIEKIMPYMSIVRNTKVPIRIDTDTQSNSTVIIIGED